MANDPDNSAPGPTPTPELRLDQPGSAGGPATPAGSAIGFLGQVGGFFVGGGKAAWEAVEFAASAGRYANDLYHGQGFDQAAEALGVELPAWLPSRARGINTTQSIFNTASEIVKNPGLIWDGIKAPYVQAWAKGRYGEAIGRGTFEAVTTVFGPKGLNKLGSIAGKLTKIDDIAEVLTAVRRADAVIPDEFAGIADELLALKRAEGKLGDVIDAARQSGTLDELLDLKKLSGEEIDALVQAGKLTPEEALRAKGAATAAPSGGANVTKSPEPAPTPVDRASSTVAKEGVDEMPGTPGPEGGNANPVPAGEPVDLITGTVFADDEDFTLPWHIPLKWKRFYSSDSRRWGALGVGWESPADFRLTLRPAGEIAFWAGKGGADLFTAMPKPGAGILQAKEGLRLERTAEQVRVQTRTGLTYCFPTPEPLANELPLLSIEDQNGNRLIFVRRNGLLAEIRSSAGPWLELQARDGLITAVILHHPGAPPRLLVSYRHSPARDLAAVEDALGVPHRFAYRNHCLIRHTDRNGLSFQYQYDRETSAGRCIRTWGDGGLHDTHIQYDPANRRATAVDSRGLVTTIATDAEQRLIRKEDSVGQVTVYEYDQGGRVAAVTDALGRRVGYRYDDLGNLLALTRPDGAVLRWTYDSRQHLTAFTDAAGATWRQEWDTQGRLVLQLSPLGAVRQYRYDAHGDLTALVDPRYGITRLEPDPRGCGPAALTDPTGRTWRWEYDGLGHVTAAIDPAGAVTRFSHDAKGRLIRIERPSGTAVQCGYDHELNLTCYVDELGQETRFDYGFVNRLTARHLPNGSRVRYDYDSENRLTAVINGRGERYSLLRDPAGRITNEIDYWGRLTSYRYDSAGHLIERVDPLGRLTRLERDALGRLTARHFADDSSERFDYDAVGNLIATDSPHGRVSRRFDVEGRLTWEDQAGFEVRFDYDLAGNLSRRTSSTGNRLDYAYDAADRLTAIRVNSETIHRIEHDVRGLPVHESFGEGLHRDSQFDPDYRLIRRWTASPFATLIERGYHWDAAGNLIQRRDPAKGLQQFDYDPVGNLIRHTDPAGQIREFLRDAGGDFLRPEPLDAPDDGSGPETGARPPARTPPAANPGSADGGDPRGRFGIPVCPIPGREPYGTPVRAASFGDLSYRYDAAGNVIERTDPTGTQRLDWDCANRLIRARATDHIPIWFGYDAQGRRLTKTRQGQTTRFGWDGDALMAEHDGRTWREYVYGPDGFTPLALIEGGKVYHYETDQVGCPHEVVEGDGRIVWSAQYDAWGGTTRITTERVRNPLRLQGQYWDEELGFAYNRYRYYDPESSCYLSTDPLGLIAGEQLFQLAPSIQRWVDPLGLTVSPTQADSANGTSQPDIETVQRWMSEAELNATRETGLLRGGRSGTHYVTNAANTGALRARQRLSLPQTPELRVTLDVPNSVFSKPSIVNPLFNMPGGGLERTATGNIPVRVVNVSK